MSAPFMWSSDAPTQGAFKEQVVLDLFEQAGYNALFRKMVEVKPVATGESATIPSDEELTFNLDNEIDENQLIPQSKINLSAKTIALKERGHLVSLTNTSQLRSPVDILNVSKDRLAQYIQRDMEGLIASTLKLAPVKYVATGAAAGNFTTNGTPSGTLASGPNFYHMRNLSRYMQDNLRVPFHRMLGNRYAAIFRYSALVSLKSDSEYGTFNRGNPNAAAALQSIGTIEDFEVYGYTDGAILNGAIGSGSAFSEGLLLGDKPAYLAIQDDNKVIYDVSDGAQTDFGRFKYVAWRGHMGCGLPSDSANAGLARVVHWTTA